MARSWAGLLFVVIIISEQLIPACYGAVEYQYKRYTYRKKRDDKRYKSARQRCEMEGECHGLWAVKHTKCIRMCMSEFCYNELYGEDELEEGEIDVRLTSFKGCLSQVKIVEDY